MPIATFIVNRVHTSTRALSAYRAAAKRAGWKPDIVVTETPLEGIAAAEHAVEAADLVVAVGGDGTVRGCAQALAGTGVPLGVVPLGTANLLAAGLGLPPNPAAALDVALTGRDRRIDVATADGDVAFAAMAGIGIDAAVVAAARFKRRLGWRAYALSGAAHLRVAPTAFSIRIDDGPPVATTARSVIVANCGLLPGGFTILPHCHPDDGVLDVGVLAPRGPLGWATLARRVMAGDGRLRRFRAQRVEITADKPLPRQADGEILPGPAARSLNVTIQPGSLLVRAEQQGRRTSRGRI